MGDQVIIGIEPLGARRIRDEIPNWILDRPASISGQIVLKKEPLDSFLGQTTRCLAQPCSPPCRICRSSPALPGFGDTLTIATAPR